MVYVFPPIPGYYYALSIYIDIYQVRYENGGFYLTIDNINGYFKLDDNLNGILDMILTDD